jgi:hypothetical protein
VEKKFNTLITNKDAISLVQLGVDLSNGNVSMEDIVANLEVGSDGYLREVPSMAPREYAVRGGPICKLLVKEMNKSNSKRIPVDYFLGRVYESLKIKMNSNSLRIFIGEIFGFAIVDLHIISYIP